MRFFKPFQSKTELPCPSYWNARRGVGGVQAEAWAWARVAMADEIVQAGFDETQIDRK